MTTAAVFFALSTTVAALSAFAATLETAAFALLEVVVAVFDTDVTFSAVDAVGLTAVSATALGGKVEHFCWKAALAALSSVIFAKADRLMLAVGDLPEATALIRSGVPSFLNASICDAKVTHAGLIFGAAATFWLVSIDDVDNSPVVSLAQPAKSPAHIIGAKIKALRTDITNPLKEILTRNAQHSYPNFKKTQAGCFNKWTTLFVSA